MRRLVPLICVCVCATWAIARPHAAATDMVFYINAVQFVDVVNGRFALQPTGPYGAAATDGSNIGVDQAALDALVPIKQWGD